MRRSRRAAHLLLRSHGAQLIPFVLSGCILLGYEPLQPQEGAGDSSAQETTDNNGKSDGGKGDAATAEAPPDETTSPQPPTGGTPTDGPVVDAGDSSEATDASTPAEPDAGSPCPPFESRCSADVAYECREDGTRFEVDCAAGLPSCVEGSCDPAQGCIQHIVADGTPCDDTDLCTTADACTDGRCGGVAVDCSDLSDACNVGLCRPQSGMCRREPVADGTACGSDLSCRAGQCTTVADCTPFGDCYVGCTERGDVCAIECAGIDACELGCANGASCTQDCTGSQQCTGECTEDSQCVTDCRGASQCTFTCGGESVCGINCQGATECGPILCRDGAKCDLNCKGVSSCAARCEDEAGCLLDCGNAATCEFELCNGTEERCAGGVTVCNRPCP